MPDSSLDLSRRDLAYAPAEVLRRFKVLGSGSLRVASPRSDVITARLEHDGARTLRLQFHSEGWCGFSYCLYGSCVFGYFSHATEYYPDMLATYDGGSQTGLLQKGGRLLSVGLSGTPTALADFLGLTTQDLGQLMNPGPLNMTRVSTDSSPTARQLRLSAMRLAHGLSDDGGHRFGLVRARASAMDFGLHMLETIDQLHHGSAGEHDHRSSVRRRVSQIAAYLEANPGSTEPLGAIAARFGFSRSAFDQAFRMWMGCSPGVFRIESRLRRVAQALQSTDSSITSLALEFGFSSSSNLTRCFRSRYGLAPTVYRKSGSGADPADRLRSLQQGNDARHLEQD